MPHPQVKITPHSCVNDFDVYLFKEGRHYQLFDKFGAHPMEIDGIQGTYFALWAPNAAAVHVIGDFNAWNPDAHPLYVRWDHSGIWEGFIHEIGQGTLYKYAIRSKVHPGILEKGDPFAFFWETPERTASIVWDLAYEWRDKGWMQERTRANSLDAPISIYEIHFGSWRRTWDNGRSLSYREMAEQLPPYLKTLGFTHVEFMPLMEHPFFGSWGYQKIGYFAPSSRFGTPQDFMFLIDSLHNAGIGVYLDWVPSHFPSDAHGLARFDGSHLFEHADPRLGFHPDWNSCIFNYGRHEVRAFLISSALFWLQRYHIDGLRVDAVSSLLYRDYSRKEGEWIPNIHGGRENLEAISWLKELNEVVYARFPDVQMIAEESTAWPMVSRPTCVGGLGFGMKWDMGWMHDTLEYFTKADIYRKYHHHQLTFSIHYFYNENFLLSLSHDEVVYGKGSLLSKMPGDEWQKRANLRLLLGYMYTHPGKKLLFMGAEFGQQGEWYHDIALEWDLMRDPRHFALFEYMRALNRFYREEKALYERDFHQDGFEWVTVNDHDTSIIAYLRRSAADVLLVACNFTHIPRAHYSVYVKDMGHWQQVFNTDSVPFGGTGHYIQDTITPDPLGKLDLHLPPLAVVIYKRQIS